MAMDMKQLEEKVKESVPVGYVASADENRVNGVPAGPRLRGLGPHQVITDLPSAPVTIAAPERHQPIHDLGARGPRHRVRPTRSPRQPAGPLALILPDPVVRGLPADPVARRQLGHRIVLG